MKTITLRDAISKLPARREITDDHPRCKRVRKVLKQLPLCLLLLLTITRASLAQKKSIALPNDNAMAQLKPGPGRDTVKASCVTCHSTDYIVRQPRMDRHKWQAEVEKMRVSFGAPISAADAKEMVDYLVKNYGSEVKENSGKK